jgi:carboxylate-amine ligase
MTGYNYDFGIEEEFFLSDAATGSLIESMPAGMLADAKRIMGAPVSCELLESQIELASPILRSTDEALEYLRRSRRTLADIAATKGLCLIAAGTHPLGTWQGQLTTQQPRYDELMADFRIVSQRNLVCGLHVHVAIPNGVDRVDVMNRAMPWAPLFLALSTSSPFWNQRVTGMLSYRQTLYDEWPRSGIPDYFADERDYAAFATLMRDTGAIRDAGHLWWVIRPALKYPTLELRIADACTAAEDSVAIAALFRCLVNALIENPRLGGHRSSHTRRVIDENRWRAKRDGVRAKFIDEERKTVRSVHAVLDELIALLDRYIDRRDCRRALEPLRRMLDEQTSAHQQLRVYNQARAAGDSVEQALGSVLRWLQQQTLAIDASQ